MPNWHDPAYLLAGTARQRQALATLRALGVWQVLRGFDPVLAGTVPLGIDLPESDLDIICEVAPAAQPAFAQRLRAHYSQLPGFWLGPGRVRGPAATVARFWHAGTPIEVFGQALPTRQQHAYRHLVVEHAVLAAGGEPWRAAVRALKQRGLKTEPAFAQLLHLPGDPYAALLALGEQPPAALAAHMAACPLPPA
ncbi:DUF4269 domain-containing protein [Hymenobacter sp. RP-2-7]|uniref:DUF4269 domain-containing protein n=1 Tax=Hymenobacter polaris TaxID=2682546 RepID=A0A7Y0FP19_9BACT|nr:DUF4269 domain-containing protein [Hymenobacter polaris]NML67543.1 DUF4269 domain-containing protein [Hymenobacter polaris]